MEDLSHVYPQPIILATLEYPPQVGGVASLCAQLVKSLPLDSVVLVTNKQNELLFRRLRPRWLKSIFTFWHQVRVHQASGILVAQVLPLGTAAVVLSKFNKLSVHILVHGLDVLGPQLHWRKKWVLRWVLRSATSIIANSRYTARVVQDLGIGHERISILPLGPHIQPSLMNEPETEWLRTLGISPEVKVIFSAGRLIKRKGFDQLIQVFPEVRKQFKQPVMLVISGSGPEDTNLKQLTQGLGCNDAVMFTGQISDQHLAQLFQRCDMFVLPTRTEPGGDVEGFGIVFLEANAFGKPVIGGKSGGVTDAIVDGLNGYLVEPNNLDMLLKAILKLLEHPEIAERLGVQGKQRLAEQFDWHKNVRVLAKHLNLV